MKINPISFRGVYHCKVNERQEPEKFEKILTTKAIEDENKSEVRIVLDHQNYESVMFSIQAFMNNCKDIPSVNWLIQHARYAGIKLPDYLDNGSYNVFVLTEKDKEDYDKTLLKREEFSKASKTIKKITKQVQNSSPKGTTQLDFFLKLIHTFDEVEQKEFDNFMKDRQTKPMSIDVDEGGTIHFQTLD